MEYTVDKCLSCETYQLGAYFCLNKCGSEVVTKTVPLELYQVVYRSNKPVKHKGRI